LLGFNKITVKESLEDCELLALSVVEAESKLDSAFLGLTSPMELLLLDYGSGAVTVLLYSVVFDCIVVFLTQLVPFHGLSSEQ
jgi:hypothetical protein